MTTLDKSAANFQNLLLVIGLCLSTLLQTGCASFNHEWKSANFHPGNDIQGRWEGTWLSDVNHHTDQLRCVINKKAEGLYRARFYAKYHKVLSFGYTVMLRGKEDAGVWTFEGEADLGWYAGGLYQYRGRVDATNFFSTYSSKYDHGTFEMSRTDGPPRSK